MKSIAVEDSLVGRADSVWAESGFNICVFERGDEKEALRLHEDSDVQVFVIGTKPYSEDFFRGLSRRCLIQRMGVGYGSVPLDLCRKLGHVIGYTPNALDEAVAEHAMMLVLATSKRAVECDALMKAGAWKKLPSFELRGKTLGLVGYGRIAAKLAIMAKNGFGMRILACGRKERLEGEGAECVDHYTTDASEAFSKSDIISIHLPENPATVGFVNAELLGKAKPGAILINTARGALLDEDAVYAKLKSGHLAAAGLDVFVNEPYKPSGDADLRDLNNIIMTPHCGSNSLEANDRMAKVCISNATRFLEGSDCSGTSFV